MPTIDPSTPAGIQPNGFTSGYTLTMSDEFNSTTLDSKWAAWHNFSDTSTPSNFDVNANNNSCLRVWPVSPYSDNETEFITQGSNPFRQRYGFYEVRVKHLRGKGMFTAPLWLFEESSQQEIDVMEGFSYENTDWLVDTVNFRLKNAVFTVWQDGGGGSTNQTGAVFLRQRVPSNTGYDNTLSTEFHTFGMRWTATEGLQWYYDGSPVGNPIPDPWGPGNNVTLYVLTGQLWWGPRAGLPTPNTTDTPQGSSNSMEIDYVRVWSIGGTGAVFNCSLTDAPADGATINGTVHFGVAGDLLQNVELLPPTGYLPMYGRFTLSQSGTVGDLSWDTTQLANGSITVRISAFNVPPGGAGTEIVVMTRTYIINNLDPDPGDPGVGDSDQQFCWSETGT